ncbi:transient receptor potential cation channel subfamily M member 2-like [Protopterus annectens]|uniref:transient receptor potential cation channel subfamily M member 2-like n=1 Tax=Protopterus annectens TaxID=7888 RepID=UPI001CF9E09F|nr:transient receptor potential cation channel subfamily M member 2-like [Protopterus annectens]
MMHLGSLVHRSPSVAADAATESDEDDCNFGRQFKRTLSFQKADDFSQNHEVNSWIPKNIMKKECAFFISKTGGDELRTEDDSIECDECGHYRSEHSEEALSRSSEAKGRRFIDVPTDAFGIIKFTGGLRSNTGKYVRASSDTKPEILYELMTKHWGLKQPNLVISVTGGAKDFIMPPKLRVIFHRALLKAAYATGAWIITGGSNAGVMKHVGEAIRDYNLVNEEKLTAIGIATWGIVQNRQILISKTGETSADYTIDDNQDHLACLDNNHTHFILVDDGTSKKYGGEISLRAALESHISKMGGTETPLVCIALEGGPGTLQTVYESMKKKTPCIVVEDSGRISNIIAHFECLDKSQVTDEEIKNKLQPFANSEEKLIKLAEMLKEILTMKNLLTRFKSKLDGLEVDSAILEALLKVSASENNTETRTHQIELAMAWNRVDIARNKIFSDAKKWKTEDLHKLMIKALIKCRPGFFKLFINLGGSLETFATENNLRELDEKHFNKYSKDTHNHVRVLFLWAILQNCESQQNYKNFPDRKELAYIIWTKGQHCIANALQASKILKAKEMKGKDLLQEMKLLAEEYEKRAIGVFTECYHTDANRAYKLLNRAVENRKGSSCLEIAISAKNDSFIAQAGVQAYLTKVWYGELKTETPLWRIFLCMLCLPLIYTGFITFRTDSKGDKHEEECQTDSSAKYFGNKAYDASSSFKKDQEENDVLVSVPSTQSANESEKSKLYRFVIAPIVIFYYNVLSYFGLLWLFAYVLMIDFQDLPSWKEYFLYAWVFTLACEEIRQALSPTGGKEYIRDLRNALDITAIMLFAAGVACRFFHATFYPGKIILSVDYILFCLRLMYLFSVSKTLGPKLIMLQRMMKDIIFFLFLMAVWVLAYGVSKQAIMMHNENRLDWIFRGVVYQPYLMIFGDIPEDIKSINFGPDSCTLNGSEPNKPKCPLYSDGDTPVFPEWLIVLLFCVYMLFANIVLLNLLIAIFNYIFEQVQENTDTVWKVQRFDLIKEYHYQPSLPPPFIIISHLLYFVPCWTAKRHDPFCDTSMKTEEEDVDLIRWEGIMQENYLTNVKFQARQSIEQTIKQSAKDISKIKDLLEAERDGNISQEKRLSHLEKEFTEFQKQVAETNEILKKILSSMEQK